MRNNHKRRPKAQKGIVLLVVMMTLTFLMVIIYDNLDRQSFVIDRIRVTSELQQAQWLAKSYMGQALEILKKDQQESSIDSLSEAWSQTKTIPSGETGFKISLSIKDVGAKLNLNLLEPKKEPKKSESKKPEQQSKQKENPFEKTAQTMKKLVGELLDKHEFEQAALNDILDWLDKDDEVTEVSGVEGHEKEQYISNGAAFIPRNAHMQNIKELYLLYDWERKNVDKILPLFGAYAECPEQKININTATAPVLQAVFTEANERDIEDILAERKEQPFNNIADLTLLTSGISEIQSILDVKSDCFIATVSITSTLSPGGKKPTNLKLNALIVRQKDGIAIAEQWWNNR